MSSLSRPKSKLRWAILGTSKIAETMAQAILKAGDELISVYTHSHLERLQGFAQRFGISHQAISLDEALKHPAINAIWVGTPNHVHAEACLSAFDRDHIEVVLSEKSLERSMAAALQIKTALQRAQASRIRRNLHPIIFREALFHLNHPIINKFQDFLRSQALGELRSITGEYCADIAQFTHPDGGGALYNLGVYPVSLLHLVLTTLYPHEREGLPRLSLKADASIQTDKAKSDPKNNYVIRSSAELKFALGIDTRITVSEISATGLSAHFAITGSHGQLIFQSNPFSPSLGDNRFDFIHNDGTITSFETRGGYDPYLYQIEMVQKDHALQQEKARAPVASIEDSLAIMELLSTWEAQALCQAEKTVPCPSSLQGP